MAGFGQATEYFDAFVGRDSASNPQYDTRPVTHLGQTGLSAS
jgi:hypothetical protein